MRLFNEDYVTPRLKWMTLRRNDQHYCGEILAAFELFQLAPEGEVEFDRENELTLPENYAETFVEHGDCEVPPDAVADRKTHFKRKYDESFIPLPR